MTEARAEELKNRLISLLKEREEAASEFQDCHDDGEWEKAQSLAMEWWGICEEIDNLKERMAKSVEKSGGKGNETL